MAIDTNKLLKLAAEYPELAPGIQGLLREASESRAVFNHLKELIHNVHAYMDTLTQMEIPVRDTLFDARTELSMLADMLVVEAKKLNLHTNNLLEGPDEDLTLAAEQTKKLYPALRRQATEKAASPDTTAVTAYVDFIESVMSLSHNMLGAATEGEAKEGLPMNLQEVFDHARVMKKKLTDLVESDDDEKIKDTLMRAHNLTYRKLRQASGEAPYPNKIDHGYDQPLTGGWDIMKRLQDQLLIEQGSEPRDPNPRLAANLQKGLIRVLQGGTAREMVRTAVVKHAAETNSVVMVNAAVEAILDQALAVALSPAHVAAALKKSTVEGA